MHVLFKSFLAWFKAKFWICYDGLIDFRLYLSRSNTFSRGDESLLGRPDMTVSESKINWIGEVDLVNEMSKPKDYSCISWVSYPN